MDLRKLIASFRYAFLGIITAFQEQNMKIHGIAAVIVIISGIFTGLNGTEWLVIILTISLVMGAEMINTAIESVVDLASPDVHPLAKKAKDIAAGAVLLFSISSVIIGLIIFIPKWFG